jgi:malonyl-CoA O-methyltransferase
VIGDSKTNLSSKKLLAESFGRAADHYDEFAHLQRHIGGSLLARVKEGAFLTKISKLSNASGPELDVVADLGCGTGYFLPQLADTFKPKSLIAADLSVDMLNVARRLYGENSAEAYADDLCFLACDAESLPLKPESCDLVFSSLAIQWCESLNSLWREVYKALKPGGCFAFSTLLDGSLFELKDAWSKVDSEQHVNSFLSLEDYLQSLSLSNLGFDILRADAGEVNLEYQKAFDLMRDLKGVGAHNISQARPKSMTGKRKIMQVVESYESYRKPNGLLPATYVAGYFVLQKSLKVD